MLTMTCDRCGSKIDDFVRDGRTPGNVFTIVVFDEKQKHLVGAVEKDLCEKCAREAVALVAKWWPEMGTLQGAWNNAPLPTVDA